MSLPAAGVADLAVRELRTGDEALLQRFFERNPLYFETVAGAPAGPGEGHEELHGTPPPGWPYTRLWHFGWVRADGELDAMAGLVQDLLAQDVWHIGLFIVATARHGRGDARAIYGAIEDWARAQGAAWLRLGAARSNPRAARFWQRCGFAEVRTRNGVVIGTQVNTIGVYLKPLRGEAVDAYLTRVPRDRGDAP